MSASARVQLSRAVLVSAALVGTVVLWLAVAQLHPVHGAMAATLAAGAALWMVRGVFSRRRVVLWLEERVPSMRYALAGLEDTPRSPFRATLEDIARQAPIGRPLAIAAARLIGIPVLLFIVSQLVVRPLTERIASSAPRVGADGEGRPRSPAADGGRLEARVTAPAYAGGQRATHRNPTSIAALVGSDIRFSGDWTEATTMPARPVAVRLESPHGTRIVALEPRADSTPRVVLELPGRDSTVASPSGAMRLAAQARDDIGLRATWFELIVSSGSGESFTFRTAVLGRRDANGARTLRFDATLRLDSLALKAGDVVHVRAVARDGNPSPDAEVGSSETRTIRVPRPGENDSLSVAPAPPPEVGQSEVSQRMLIILTERLVGRMQRLSTEAVQRESAPIARDQGRLRKRVGEIIFSRLTGEEHDDDDLDAVMADTLSPAEALLRAADAATDIEIGHAHGDEGPVVGVNRPLLEAFNAMWDAERELNVGAPRRALPHMRAALDAIQRARAAERLYLRGRAPRVVIDEARIRLAGKREEMNPAVRSARASGLREVLERRTRFSRALELLRTADLNEADRASRASQAIDSLMVLRIDVLEEQPAVASALSAAIADLRSGRDATDALIAARRALYGAPVTGRQHRWSGGW